MELGGYAIFTGLDYDAFRIKTMQNLTLCFKIWQLDFSSAKKMWRKTGNVSHHLPSLQQDLKVSNESAIFTQDRNACFVQFLGSD